MKPKTGDKAECDQCGRQIEYCGIRTGWQHVGATPRHNAKPKKGNEKSDRGEPLCLSDLDTIKEAYDKVKIKYKVFTSDQNSKYQYLILIGDHPEKYEFLSCDDAIREAGHYMEFLDGKIASY